MKGWLASWLRLLAMTTAVAVILAMSGGFGSSVLGTLSRLGYWFGLCTAGAIFGNIVAHRIPDEWFERRKGLAWASLVGSIVTVMTPLVALTNAFIRHRTFGLDAIMDVFSGTVVTTGGIVTLAMLVQNRRPVETHAAPVGAAPAKFLERLPAKLRGAELWAVEAQDHYLRLHTSLGRDLILMRLSDAVAELEGLEGARTHRSWWVARAAVTGVERAEGRATLTLIDGTEAPVSRAFNKALKEAGWFDS